MRTPYLKAVECVDSNDRDTATWLYTIYTALYFSFRPIPEHSSSASSSLLAECDVTAGMHPLSDLYGPELFSGHFSLVSVVLFGGSMPKLEFHDRRGHRCRYLF